MGDDNSNFMGIRRPSLFICILDFIVFLVLAIGILQVSYTPNAPLIKLKEESGRISVTVMLLLRFLISTVTEYLRVKIWKIRFVDKRDSFKIFSLCRLIFLITALIPVMIIATNFLEFKGTMIAIISSILLFQELVTLIIIVFKIRNSAMS